jgi:hypothetical protein
MTSAYSMRHVVRCSLNELKALEITVHPACCKVAGCRISVNVQSKSLFGSNMRS